MNSNYLHASGTPTANAAAVAAAAAASASVTATMNGNASNNLNTPINNTNSINNGNTNQGVSKLNLQQHITNGLFIRKEIQRFESVHPNIYTVYDLVDNIADFNLQQQLREHIVNIEGSPTANAFDLFY